jgi:hypothetical protein
LLYNSDLYPRSRLNYYIVVLNGCNDALDARVKQNTGTNGYALGELFCVLAALTILADEQQNHEGEHAN